MEDSRSSSPDQQPQDLWGSILDSVSSTRSIPSKHIILLGQPSSGKSTLASALLHKAASEEEDSENRGDFALGYEWADVRDDADEDTLARLSVYTVPSTSPSYTSLLPHFLPPRTTLPHSLVVIVLDWTRPWTFVEDLHTWLRWVDTWTKGDGSREVEVVRDECRERLQSLLQHYTEPTSDPLPASSSLANSELLPLGPGTFTHNPSGIPIIVACTKADLIDEGSDLAGVGASGMGGMVKGKGGEWEERTDSVMQILRTICLKYGAALFYTTQAPSTLNIVRQYALHQLFAAPPSAPGTSSSTDAPPTLRNPFPFQHRPNTLDRDRIVVPAGWDSWGKIGVLRDGFDAKLWGDAWEQDLEGDAADSGAKRMYSALVPDQGTKPPPLPPLNNPTPEQAFLAKNYDENAKKTDRDPRSAFRNPADAAGASAAGLVGPLGSSSFNLPNVEKALSEMEVSVGANNLGMSVAGDKRPSTRTSGRPPASLASSVSPTSLPAHGAPGRGPASPVLSGGSPSPTGGQTQHEVLQNFFQSLLSSRAAGGSQAGGNSSVPNGGADTGS